MTQEKHLKTLGLVITDGVGYRNFMLSSFPEVVGNDFKKVVVFSGLPSSVYDHLDSSIFEIIELPVYRESKYQWFWRKLRETAHLQMFRKNAGMADNRRANYRTGWKPNDILIKIIYAWSRISRSEKSVSTFEKYQIKSFKNDPIFKQTERLLDSHKTNLLFFTHQRPPFVATIVYAAQKLHIPTATFIFSWDNLASKGRMAASFDHHLVWSDLMKTELLEFYKNISVDQVAVVGTPQFEPYVLDPHDLNQEWFYDYFRIKRNQKIICYSCADASIGPNDPLVIETIAEAIKDERIKNAQLLVRTSPAEDESRFQAIKERFPEIHWNHPQWQLTRENHPEPWSQRIPEASEIAQLKAVLQFSDLNINMCSTMSLDFMIFDKPVINTVFGNEKNGFYNDQRFLEYTHYKRVVESGAVSIAKNETQLIDQINFSLENPNARLENQRDLVKLQISKPLEGTSERIAQVLRKLAES